MTLIRDRTYLIVTLHDSTEQINFAITTVKYKFLNSLLLYKKSNQTHKCYQQYVQFIILRCCVFFKVESVLQTLKKIDLTD